MGTKYVAQIFLSLSLIQVTRNILASNPRVTRFNIDWETENNENKPPAQENCGGASMGAGMMANPMLGKVEGLAVAAPSHHANADSNSSIPDYSATSTDMEH